MEHRVDDLAAADTEALIRWSAAVREDASALLRAYHVVEDFGRYGEVRMTGAYRWDLMLAPDVDLYVINPDLTLDLAMEAFLHFVRRGDFLWFGFGDSVRARPAWKVPEGYFLGMSREFRGRHWKVETWFLPDPLPPCDWLEKPMTDRIRRVILQLKREKILGRLSVSSYHIYEAVICGGAREPNDVLAWIEKP
jgi:hypothetical protein